jgi:DNA-directed RNA polymerase beta' subunit
MDKKAIQHQIESVRFDMYDSETIRRIATKPLTESVAYDNLGGIVSNGLHDSSLGVSAYDKMSNCVTCGMDTNNCPGHLGYIELSAPIYAPFMMKTLLRILNSKCFNCHKLKLHKRKKLYFLFKFILIKTGLLLESEKLYGLMFNSSIEASPLIDHKIDCFLRTISDPEDENIRNIYEQIDIHTGNINESFESREHTITNDTDERTGTVEKIGRAGSIDTMNTDENTNTMEGIEDSKVNKKKGKGKKQTESNDDAQLKLARKKVLNSSLKILTGNEIGKIIQKLINIKNLSSDIDTNSQIKLK